MFGEFSDVQWDGLGFVYLGIALVCALALRRVTPVLAHLYIPASVIAGFLILLLGPQVLGALTGGWAVFPESAIAVMERLPGLLINVVFAGIMLGKRLPSMQRIWTDAAPHVIFGGVFSFGQFALGACATALLLTPVFGLPEATGAIMEMSFAGGHGTIAGMGGLLVDAGAGELIDVGLGLATVSMVTGIVGGSLLVAWATRSPRSALARVSREPASAPTSLQQVAPNDGDEGGPGDVGLGSISRAFGAIAVAIALGVIMLYTLRWAAGALGSQAFDNFPLFPFTVIGGFIVQLALSVTRHESLVSRSSVNEISGLSLDLLVAAAIGSMSLAALGANLPSLAVLTVIAVGWSVVVTLCLGPRIHGTHWFAHAIADYGQSQGNVATGFILADMVDPDQATTASRAYGYKQLIYGPLLGGGIITAFSVPVLFAVGTMWFALATAGITVLLAVWGVLRQRRSNRL